jgi:hypothetical protein
VNVEQELKKKEEEEEGTDTVILGVRVGPRRGSDSVFSNERLNAVLGLRKVAWRSNE